MNTFFLMIFLFLFFGVQTGWAETLEERIKRMEETIQKQQEVLKEQQKALDDLKEQASKEKAASEAEATQQVKELKEKLDQVVEAQKKYVPSVFNPSIGFVGETIFSFNNKGSQQTGSDRPGGFDVNQRSMELDLAAFIDPFARGYAVINASADTNGDNNLEVEEAALQTTSLPWNLTLKAGLFFAEYGRLSYIHDHELPFVNRPQVLDQYIGGESKTYGLQLNYLLPISHYVSLTAGVGTQFGSPSNPSGDYRQPSELNYWGRASTYFDLTPDISLETGLSGLWNPNSNGLGGPIVQADGSTFSQRERRLAGVDLVLAYRPLRDNQFKSLTWGTEVLYSSNRYDVTSVDSSVSRNTVDSFGLYSYLAYKFHRQWTTGFLFQWLENAQNKDAQTYSYSPYITWALSHWNQLRLQYTHTDNNAATGLSSNDAVYLQWTWIIGSHAHGWQAR